VSIVVKEAALSYSDSPVLSGVNAVFGEGDVHLILGTTGSGKSTFALAIAGLLKVRTGSIAIDGQDPASPKFDRRLVQLAFQFPETQIFETSVEREITYGLSNFGVGPEESADRCRWALECMGLERGLLPRDPDSLSFGEKRKVALASVIALRPRYLILDEPLAGLDWHGRAGLVAAIRNLSKEGLTSLILTHETDLLGDIGDTVSIMHGKTLISPVHADKFLDSGEPAGREMVPDYLRALGHLRARGLVGGSGLRQPAEIASAILAGLGRGE
jgi:energy-coupling factor transport system ATP-binding protein